MASQSSVTVISMQQIIDQLKRLYPNETIVSAKYTKYPFSIDAYICVEENRLVFPQLDSPEYELDRLPEVNRDTIRIEYRPNKEM